MRTNLRAAARGDRRADGAGADLAGALQERVHPEGRRDRREGASRRRARDPGRLPGGGHGSDEPRGARRRLRRRRIGEVAVRRTRRRLPVRPAGSRSGRSSRASSAGPRTRARSSSRPARSTTPDAPERFQSGTPNVPALYSCRAGYEIVGGDWRRRDSREVAAADAAASSISRARPASGSIRRRPTPSAAAPSSSTCPDGEAVRAELIRRGVIVDHRPGAGIRMAPHFYNTIDEIEHAMEELESLIPNPSSLIRESPNPRIPESRSRIARSRVPRAGEKYRRASIDAICRDGPARQDSGRSLYGYQPACVEESRRCLSIGISGWTSRNRSRR